MIEFGNEHYALKKWECGVYKIVFNDTWFYIGSSVDLKRRLGNWKHYISGKSKKKRKNRSIDYILPAVTKVRFEILEFVGCGQKEREDAIIKENFNNQYCINIVSDGGRKLPLGVIRREKNKKGGLPVPKKPIAQFTLDGSLVAKHESILAASIAVNCKTDNIRSVIQGAASRYKNWLFKQIAADGSYIEPPKFKKKLGKIALRVNQYDKNGVFIASFESANEAAAKVNGNRRNIHKQIQGKGRMKSYKGFIFKYA